MQCLKLTAPAKKLWESIAENDREQLLANVWCGQCRHDVAITNYSGAVQSGNILLTGVCAECGNQVTRLVEFEDRDDGYTYVLLGLPKLTEAEHIKEMKLQNQEADVFMKRLRALTRKSNNATITKKEGAELNRLTKKGLTEISDKTLQVVLRKVRPNVKAK
jgi:hypothetical protein